MREVGRVASPPPSLGSSSDFDDSSSLLRRPRPVSQRLTRENIHRTSECPTFLPSGFANTCKCSEDTITGVTFQQAYRSAEGFQPPKVLHYDARKLLASRSPWRALFTETRRATIAWSPLMVPKVARAFAIALAAAFLGGVVDAGAEEAAGALNTMLAAGLFFLLGPFVGTAASRWWQIRKDCVGGLWGIVDDLSVYSAAWFNKETPADKAARELVLRLGLASHALLVKQARGALQNLDDLLDAGILLEHEAAALASLPSKPQVIWAWITLFWTRALAGELECSDVPHAPFVAPLIMKKCMEARGAIGTALAFIDTQQPFPYVHLLSVITTVASAVNAILVGLETGRMLHKTAICPEHSDVPCLADYFWGEALASRALMVGFALIRLVAFTLTFDGLLHLAIALDNPLGEDPTDFPALAFHLFIKTECEAFSTAIDLVDTSDDSPWWAELTKKSSRPSTPPTTY